MARLKVAFIGCGRIADLHARAYTDNARACIHAVCDVDRERAARCAAEWGAKKVSADAAEVLADPGVDAVEILTPQASHEALAVAALRAGKHVALQKPMTIDLPSADRILRAAAASGSVFKVTENYACYPPIVHAKRLLDDGRIGDPMGVRIKLLSGSRGGWPIPASAWEWRVKEAAAGRGFLTFDHGHHLWATAWTLLGDFERVTAWIDSADGVIDAPAIVMWKHAGKRAYGTCDLMHATDLEIPSAYYANDEWIEITGTRGVLFIHRATGTIHEGPVVSVFGEHGWEQHDIPSDWGLGFTHATENFIDAIEGKAPPLLSGKAAREILRFSLALHKSARLRREVFVEEMDRRAPGLYAWQRRRAERGGTDGDGILARLGLGANFDRFAPMARSLTEERARDVDPNAAAGVETVVALHLTPQGGIEERFGVYVTGGTVTLRSGELPEGAKLTLRIPSGVWAAILMKKTRIETALFRGQIRVEGRAEEAMKLRALFRI